MLAFSSIIYVGVLLQCCPVMHESRTFTIHISLFYTMDGSVDGFVFSDEIRNSDYRVTGKMSELYLFNVIFIA